MQEWVPLNRLKVNQATKQIIDGVELEIYVSPYDVPEGVRGNFNADKKHFVIDFRYAGGETENLYSEEVEPHITLHLGRNSRRIYHIVVDTVSLGAKEVGLVLGVELVKNQVQHAIDTLAEKPGLATRLGNYRLTKKVIADNSERLFSGAH